MAVEYNFISSHNLVRSTNFNKKYIIYNKETILSSEWKNFNYRIIVKEWNKIDNLDSEALYNKEFEIKDGIIDINLLPEDTIKFPVTKSSKPHILAIRVYSKKYNYSKEFLYKINVIKNIINNIY